MKIIDTSILIDGRIADICKSGFLEGTLLSEVRFTRTPKHCDSTDILRRAKGRRGLDVLKTLQETAMECQIEIIEENPRMSGG